MQTGLQQGSLRNLESVVQFGFGLRLASDLPIPGAIPDDSGRAGEPVRITLRGKCKPIAEPSFERDADAIVYRHPCGQFRCEEDFIGIEPGEQASLQDLGELLVANALPALLWQQGAFVLHAACVRLPGGPTVAIAGPSGAGKSRLAASLVAGGAELIGDDSLALFPTDQGVQAKGLPGGWFARRPEGGLREFRKVTGGPGRGECLLDVLLVLGGQGREVARFSTIEALEQLLQHRHRPQVPLLLGRQAAVLALAAAIARRLPIASLDAQALISCDPIATCAFLADLARHGSCASPSGDADSARL